MPRFPYAAKTLLAEVTKVVSADARMEPADDPDGFGVHRTFRFDKHTSARLASMLTMLGDRRLSSVKLTEAGYLHVTFVPGTSADTRDGFGLEDAALVLADQTEESSEE